jgi:pimeloyl-ACP methyl ester carboxylesterase
MRTIWAVLAFSTLAFGAAKTETGDLNGAKFRIDVPENWNGGLVMYCHGYSPKPATYENPKLSPVLQVFLDQGFAVAQSGYASGGWAIQEAVTDTETLRRYFVAKYGKTKETFVTGHSMGGFLTMYMMEQFPNVYDAGLPLCGPLAPPSWFMARGAFDGRVIFDYYFPGVLPNPAKVPASFVNDREIQDRVLKALDAAPEKAEIIRRMNGMKNNRDLAGVLAFVTYVLRELQERAAGNPFDNRNIVYMGVGDDNAVNAGVSRYASDSRAAEYVRAWYTPTGKISRPMLAIHTSYDPLVPTYIPNMYQVLAEQSGSANLFVQQYVTHDGHCSILPAEVAQGFRELRAWKDQGVRPRGGAQKKMEATGGGQ